MKIKVQSASNLQLDWLVAKCEGVNITFGSHGPSGQWEMYSTNWAQGGPIIEREEISQIKLESGYGVNSKGYTTTKRIPVFGAVIGEYFDTDMQRNSYGESYGEIYYMGTELVTTGPTPLIAAMRCFVASKLGESVEVPDELCE